MDKYLVQLGVEFPARDCVIKALGFLNWLKLLPTFSSAGISTTHTVLNQFQPRRESWKPRKHVVLFTRLFMVQIAEQTPTIFYVVASNAAKVWWLRQTFLSPLLKGRDLSLIYYKCETSLFLLIQWFNALGNALNNTSIVKHTWVWRRTKQIPVNDHKVFSSSVSCDFTWGSAVQKILSSVSTHKHQTTDVPHRLVMRSVFLRVIIDFSVLHDGNASS